jgi:hypothetical protein
MDYVLPFDDDNGERWWLQGAKHVERRGLRVPWQATRPAGLEHWTGPGRPVMVSHIVLFIIGSEGLA